MKFKKPIKAYRTLYDMKLHRWFQSNCQHMNLKEWEWGPWSPSVSPPVVEVACTELKRTLRVTAKGLPSSDYFRELSLTLTQWEALKKPTTVEEMGDLVVYRVEGPGTLWQSKSSSTLVWYGGGQSKYYLSPLGMAIVPLLPDCPPRSEWPEMTPSQKKAKLAPNSLTKVERGRLEKWGGVIMTALPMGKTEAEEGSWLVADKAACTLRSLALKGLLEAGVGYVEKVGSVWLPAKRGKVPRIVYRRTARALLAYG